METVKRAQDWIKENVPLLAIVYENKYVGMLYDRFASLPPKQQKQMILGAISGVLFIAISYIFLSYLSLWSDYSKIERAREMEGLILRYQKDVRDKGPQLDSIDRNSRLLGPGQFKQALLGEARSAQISPRQVEVTEKPEGNHEEGGTDMKILQATVTLNRVNLAQVKAFLSNVELGQQNLSVSSVKISNDEKLRGYMKVEMGIVAYVFQSPGGGGG